MHQGKPHCYTDVGACADGTPTSREYLGNVEWSFLACTAATPDLAAITTAAENSFAKKLTEGGKGTWLGLSDKGSEKTWRYAGSECVITFEAWNSGEPSNMGGTKTAVP